MKRCKIDYYNTMISSGLLITVVLMNAVESFFLKQQSPPTTRFSVTTTATTTTTPSASIVARSVPYSCLFSTAGDNDDDEPPPTTAKDYIREQQQQQQQQQGPEQSQMYDFISDYLTKESGGGETMNDENYFTHLIAIPVGSCDELMIELESVQRAILYHCPVLVHSCIVPATMRLPLLYVKVPVGGAITSKDGTQILNNIVQDLVQKHIFVPSDSGDDNDKNDNDVNTKDDDEEDDSSSSSLSPPPAPLDGANEDGIKPLMVTFQSLEIDGSTNEVLNTVALSDDPGTRRLQNLVLDLKQTIDASGWKTSLPIDEHIEGDRVFRPRIPFMRLPPDFKDLLEPLEDDSEDAEFLRPSEEGGNGISPIFWCQWWDDTFGTVRLREISVYPRSNRGGNRGATSTKYIDENTFHLPYLSTPLPGGNQNLTKIEQKFGDYQEQRMIQAGQETKAMAQEYQKEQQQPQQKEQQEPQNQQPQQQEQQPGARTLEDDPIFIKTRERLEQLYANSDQLEQPLSISEVAADNDDNKDNEKDEEEDDNDNYITIEDTSSTVKAYDDDYVSKEGLLDDWTLQRIRKANNDNEKDDDDGNDDYIANEGTSSTVKAYDDDSVSKEGLLDDWTLQRIRKALGTDNSVDEEVGDNDIDKENGDDTSTSDTADNKVVTTASSDDDDDDAPVWKETLDDEKNALREEDDDEERLRKIVQNREIVRSQTIPQKEKVPYEENPIFRRFKEGTLVGSLNPEGNKKNNNNGNGSGPQQQEEEENLATPPWPSRESFVGVWRVVTSPTGLPTDDELMLGGGGDETKSDNFILRVDGTTFGGPVLDPETNQKAAGGTWTMIDDNDGGEVQLRIRLVIPPKRERILVMLGNASKSGLKTTALDDYAATSTFGIPQVEAKLKAAREGGGGGGNEEDMGELFTCNGKVWIEDAITGKNKKEIGTFSLMKLGKHSDPSQYTVTIPRPTRSQD